MKNDFLLGFECECVLDSKVFNKRQLKEELNKVYPGIRISDDASIYVDDYLIDYPYTAELVTPPIKLDKAFAVLSGIFKIINKAGSTNYTTGLHVNISPVNKDLFNKMNYLYIAYHPIFPKIAKTFGRAHNRFCTPNKIPKNLWLKTIMGQADFDINQGKDAAINLDYVTPQSRKARRIEVRAFGNKNYHRRLTEIKAYVYKILNLIETSCKYTFDYIK